MLVTSGPMDVSACALGSGVIEEGHCCSIIGTAALHEMVIGEPLKDNIRAGMTVTHAARGRWLRLMASLAGTPNLEWMLNTLGRQVKEDAAARNQDVYSYSSCSETCSSQTPMTGFSIHFSSFKWMHIFRMRKTGMMLSFPTVRYGM